MKKWTISEQTRRRCKIINRTEENIKDYHYITPQASQLLLDSTCISFSIYFCTPDHIIEYIRPIEFNSSLLKNLKKASDKTDQVFIAVRNQDYITFEAAINKNRKNRLNKLLKSSDNQLNPVVTATYGVICEVSQSIINNGVRPEVIEQAEKYTASVISSIFEQPNCLFTLNKIINLDHVLYDHSAMVSMLMGLIGKELNLKISWIEHLVLSGLFHDIGKIKVPLSILNKPARLTDAEFIEMKKHPQYGINELKNISLPSIVSVVTIQHHEQFKGGGYPIGRKGRYEEEMKTGIHLFSRICTVADVYSAMVVHRVYSGARKPEEVMIIMRDQMSDHFDPIILNRFFKMIIASVKPEQMVNYKEFVV